MCGISFLHSFTSLWCLCPLKFILNNFFCFSEAKYFWFCNYSLPRDVYVPGLSLKIGMNLLPWMELFLSNLYSQLRYSTRVFQLRFCRGLTTCLLYVSPPFGNLYKWRWVCKFDIIKKVFRHFVPIYTYVGLCTQTLMTFHDVLKPYLLFTLFSGVRQHFVFTR